MHMYLLVPRLLLAAVFFTAGLAKLRDLAGSRKAVIDFGAPPWLASPVGTMLPFIELATAALLLPARTAYWGALASIVLLSGFIAAISVNLARGKTPDCRCFGQVRSTPIGSFTLLRNAVLALCAVFVAMTSRDGAAPSIASTLQTASAGGVAAAIGCAAIVGQTWLIFHLFKQQGRLLLRLDALEERLDVIAPNAVPARAMAEGLPLGTPAPVFRLPSLSGDAIELDTLWRDGKMAMLVFVHPECGPCESVVAEIPRWHETHADRMRIAIISSGPKEISTQKIPINGHGEVFLQKDTEVADAYNAHATPAAVLIRPDGMIASGIAIGHEAISELLADQASS